MVVWPRGDNPVQNSFHGTSCLCGFKISHYLDRTPKDGSEVKDQVVGSSSKNNDGLCWELLRLGQDRR
jgi:hypothetical protein